jgi:sec-independent protein translocase protein TatA
MGALRGWHIIVLVGVIVLLFGAKRLPDAARALGRSLRIIKAETRGLADDDVQAKAEAPSARSPIAQSDDRSTRSSARATADPCDCRRCAGGAGRASSAPPTAP